MKSRPELTEAEQNRDALAAEVEDVLHRMQDQLETTADR